MKISLEELRQLVESGPEAAHSTLKFLMAREGKAEEIRRKDAERKRIYAGIPPETTGSSSGNPSEIRRKSNGIPPESPPSVSPPITPSSNSPHETPNGVSKNNTRSELLAVVDGEHADALIAHRKSLKHPLDPYKAKLLAGKLRKCPDPNAAADEMIARSWRSIEPSWLDGGQRSHGPPAKRSTLMDAAFGQLDKIQQENSLATEPTLALSGPRTPRRN